jgi:AAA+ superfamily predicted ATPase
LLYPVHKNESPVTGLESTLDALRQFISYRIQAYFSKDNIGDVQPFAYRSALDFIEPAIAQQLPQSPSGDEWITLLLAMVPHIQPDFFASLIAEHLPSGGDFPQFGGVKANNHRGLLPTGETVQFILAGQDLEQRLRLHQLFSEGHFFYKAGILWLEPVKEGEPLMSGRIIIAQDWLDRILFNKETVPRFGLDFPAKKITTDMVWDDVVLNPFTRVQVNEIGKWLKYHHLFREDSNLRVKIKPGYRVVFHGPAGTGKTLTAALLGKQFEKDVYRIDLSQVVSKYIGETEKNLENIFMKAETKNWILFFDEADALFGKRTNVQSSHDKYANQEVSYLLQRVEDYPGLMILASNYKNNLDEAFIRRFHSLIHFPMPNAAERLVLWQKSMPAGLTSDQSISLEELANKYEMSGAAILNAVHFATLQTYARNDTNIYQKDLLDGIRKEYLKEDKSF